MALIGFRITDLNNQEMAARNFIAEKCLIYSPEVIDNLIDNWRTLNIYSDVLTEEMLDALPFSVFKIFTTENITCINNVDFKLELPFIDTGGQSRVLKLNVTEYSDITRGMYEQLIWFIKKAYIRCIPTFPVGTGDFIDSDFESSDFFTEHSTGSYSEYSVSFPYTLTFPLT